MTTRLLSRKSILTGIIFLTTISSPMLAQNINSRFHSRVSAVYNFHPHTLGDKELNLKSSGLDKFWEDVTKNKTSYLPLLRNELSDSSNPSFFFYDGSKLLLSLSDSPDDNQLALKSIPRSDIRDVQPTDYLLTVHHFAVQGLNTKEVSFHILDDPTFKAYIPQHAFALGQAESLIFMLLPTNESYYLQNAASRLKVEREATAKASLILLLHYSATDVGDQSLNDFVANPSQPDSLKHLIKQLQESVAKIPSMKLSSSETYDSLKEQRKISLRRVSDEALYEFNELSAKIYLLRTKK